MKVVATLCFAWALFVPAAATTLSASEAIARLFISDKIDADWFAASVLQEGPLERIQVAVDQLKSQLGAYQGVRAEGDHYSTMFAAGSVPTYVALDDTGRIRSLVFKPPVPKHKDLSARLDALKALPGHISVIIEGEETPLVSFEPDKPLASGPTFRLAVLQAIKKRVDAKQLSWEQIATVRRQWKSLPSGILHTWPDGAPLTLYSVAALMISQSDNTASDLALRTVGRPAAQAEAPRNDPLLTTREAFELKDPSNAALLQRWRAGRTGERQAVLSALASRPLPSVDLFNGGVAAPDVEWFFSVRELCSLMRRVASLPFMGINPGVADPSRWARVAYAGGSEPGVLNLTTQLTTKSGKTYCVSATWNDVKPLDEKQFELTYGLLLNSLEL